MPARPHTGPDRPADRVPVRRWGPGPPGLVRYHGFFYSSSGYAAEARTAVRYLHEHGYRLELVPRGRTAGRFRALDYATKRLLDSLPVYRPGPTRPSSEPRRVDFHHVPPFMMRPDPGAPANVGRTMIETDVLPPGWARACAPLDEVWVPSTFNAAAFAEAGFPSAKVRVVPIGVDPDLFKPRERPPLPWNVRTRGFRFLSVFVWQPRKAWDVLVKAYLREFGPGEDVTLIIKTQPVFCGMEAIVRSLDAYVRDGLGLNPERAAPIVILRDELTPQEMASLYNSCDAFVLPSRGEGFGRPYLEAMASGLPTIGTRWSGNLDFMTEANSYLVDLVGLVPATGNLHPGSGPNQPARAGPRWAEPSAEHLRELLRRVCSNRAEARAKADQARVDVVSRWSARATCGVLAYEMSRFL